MRVWQYLLKNGARLLFSPASQRGWWWGGRQRWWFDLLLYEPWQVLTGLEALSLRSRNNAEEEGELRTQNGFRLSKYTWANRSLEHARPLRGSSSACRVPLWSVRSCMWWAVPPSWNTLFVFTVALWDAIALPPLLPTVKQHYWGCPLLLSSAENYQCIRLLLLHWLANARRRRALTHTHLRAQKPRVQFRSRPNFLPNSTGEVDMKP